MGAPANVPITGHPPEAWGQVASPTSAPEERARQNTPLWMETPSASPESRRGAPPPARSGMHTLLFFGLIVFVVGAAGIGGVALWGPEKPIKNRTQFATNPPAPVTLPSLQASAATAPAVAEAAPAPAPDPSTPPAEDAPSSKKGKKAPKVWKKRR